MKYFKILNKIFLKEGDGGLRHFNFLGIFFAFKKIFDQL